MLCKGVEIVVLKIGILGEIDKINFYIYDYVVVSYKFLNVWLYLIWFVGECGILFILVEYFFS